MNKKVRQILRNPAWRMILVSGLLTAGVLYGIQRIRSRVTKRIVEEQKTKEQQFSESLAAFVEQSKHGRFREVLGNMIQLELNSFTKKQERDWNKAMGQIYDHHTWRDSSQPELDFKLAVKFYTQGLEKSETPEDKTDLYLLLGSLYLKMAEYEQRAFETQRRSIETARAPVFAATKEGEEKKAKGAKEREEREARERSRIDMIYMTASRYLNRIQRDLLPPETVWEVDLKRAKCNWRIGSHQKGLDLTYRVIDAADNQEIWAESVVQAGEWMLEASQKEELIEILSKTKLTRVDPDRLMDKARDNFNVVIAQTETLDESHGRAQLGLLRILVIEDKLNQAIEVANTIRTEVMPEHIQMQSLVEIANAHQAKAKTLTDPKEAEKHRIKELNALHRGHLEFPHYTRANPLTNRLYKRLVETENWEEAFVIAESAVETGKDRELLQCILDDFHPKAERFFDKLGWRNTDKRFYERTIRLLNKIQALERSVSAPMAEQAMFLKSAIPVAALRYGEAEQSIVLTLQRTKDPDYRQWLMYLDLFSSLRTNKPAAIRALRAKRYITAFPNGQYLGYAITVLMQAYYTMELYEQAMETAKLMFIKEIVKLGDEGSDSESNEWLHTVMKIAQCYAKEGKVNKANIIYRSYLDDVMNSNLPDDVYVDYARLSLVSNQHHEAIKRLDKIIPRIEDLFTQYQQKVARSVRTLMVKDPGSVDQKNPALTWVDLWDQANALVQEIENAKVLDEEALRRQPVELPPEKVADFRAEQERKIAFQRDEVRQGKRLTIEQREKLLRRLYEGMLTFAFTHQTEKGVDFDRLVEKVHTRFKDQDWPEYWILRMLADRFSEADLADTLKRYQENLKLLAKDSQAYDYIKRQIGLIADLDEFRGHRKRLQERGVLR